MERLFGGWYGVARVGLDYVARAFRGDSLRVVGLRRRGSREGLGISLYLELKILGNLNLWFY